MLQRIHLNILLKNGNMRIVNLIVIFLLGAFAGYILEFCFRNIVHKSKNVIDPGFLKGPYLPLYGFGVLVLYILSSLEINILLKILLFAFSITILELITGLFFEKYFQIKLWDYSKNKLNYKGIICPLFSFIWTLLSLMFYYFVYPVIEEVSNFILYTPDLFFISGVVFGFFLIDVCISLNISYKIQKLTKINKRKIQKITKKNKKMIKKKIKNNKKRIQKIVLSFEEFKENSKMNFNLSRLK